MKNNLPKICYWCGIELTPETNKREHVPPNSFFPKGYKEQLITVPSCEEHNTQFSTIDERFKIYIQSMGTNQIAIDDFKDKTVRGLNREQSRKFVESLSENSFYTEIDGEQKLVFKIDPNHTDIFIEKIFRGIYFYHKEKPATGKIMHFSVQLFDPDLDYEALMDELLMDLISDAMVEGDYKNPEIFRYRFFDLPDFDAFIAVFNFYKGVEIIAWVIPEQMLTLETEPEQETIN
jgi:hypothetical protein